MATTVSQQPQRVTLCRPDPRTGEQIIGKEWYRTISDLVRAVGELQAANEALSARVVALGG